MKGFSLQRWWGIVLKEFLQLRRDRITFAMIVGIPIIQLTLFGFAINTDPKHLRTGVLNADDNIFSRSFIASMKATNYFDFVKKFTTEEQGQTALAKGQVQFLVNIPAGFSHQLIRTSKT